MKKIWALLGQTTFFITKPLISVYLKSSHRTRIILISEGHILLAKDWLGNGKYSLPGGGIKKREDSSLAAARELKEETGIAIRSSQLKLLKDKLWVNP
jgi:8-oxo-dGTP pyrophosphatase MutT (NUDIX family)